MSRKRMALLVLIACVLSALPFGAGAQTLKIAAVVPDGTAWMREMRNSAKEITDRTEGRVRFKFYPGGVMGNDKGVLRKIRIGQLHGGAITASGLTAIYRDAVIGLQHLAQQAVVHGQGGIRQTLRPAGV